MQENGYTWQNGSQRGINLLENDTDATKRPLIVDFELGLHARPIALFDPHVVQCEPGAPARQFEGPAMGGRAFLFYPYHPIEHRVRVFVDEPMTLTGPDFRVWSSAEGVLRVGSGSLQFRVLDPAKPVEPPWEFALPAGDYAIRAHDFDRAMVHEPDYVEDYLTEDEYRHFAWLQKRRFAAFVIAIGFGLLTLTAPFAPTLLRGLAIFTGFGAIAAAAVWYLHHISALEKSCWVDTRIQLLADQIPSMVIELTRLGDVGTADGEPGVIHRPEWEPHGTAGVAD